MLNRVESGQRELDSTAQEVLAKYVGWGGLSKFLTKAKRTVGSCKKFFKRKFIYNRMLKLQRSTLTAFYTPKAVIDSIYKYLDNLGFEKEIYLSHQWELEIL